MNLTVDASGRIELPEAMRTQLGLKAGDHVAIEEDEGRWIIKAGETENLLRWDGNVLVYGGDLLPGAYESLGKLRSEREDDFVRGVST